MGQKVNPHGLRVGIIKDWDAKWYAEKDFADNLIEDVKIRKFIKKKLYAAGVSKILIARKAQNTTVTVVTAKPGIVVGRGGQGIEELNTLKDYIEKLGFIEYVQFAPSLARGQEYYTGTVFEVYTKDYLVVTFLSILDLAKNKNSENAINAPGKYISFCIDKNSSIKNIIPQNSAAVLCPIIPA